MDAGRPLRILFVVDFRSEIARGWIRWVANAGHQVFVVSSFPLTGSQRAGYAVEQMNIAFSRFTGRDPAGGDDHDGGDGVRSALDRVIRSPAAHRAWHAVSSTLAPVEAGRHRSHLQRIVHDFRPHVVHAMRIPYEGVVTAGLRPGVPFLLSIWGNDLTLWARRSRRMGAATRRVLARADALHTDCERDARLAREWGFPAGRPAIVLPGGGGIDEHVFHPGDGRSRSPLVVNPRGIRQYVRNDCFLRALPKVIGAVPGASASCVDMAGNRELERLVADLRLDARVRLLPALAPFEMADLYRTATVSVSPSVHDGTPNTLLEAMASGCLPVAGDIESVREWVEDGRNGLLCDPTSPQSIAEALVRALTDRPLQRQAAALNAELIARRARRAVVMEQAVAFYRSLAGGGS